MLQLSDMGRKPKTNIIPACAAATQNKSETSDLVQTLFPFTHINKETKLIYAMHYFLVFPSVKVEYWEQVQQCKYVAEHDTKPSSAPLFLSLLASH